MKIECPASRRQRHFEALDRRRVKRRFKLCGRIEAMTLHMTCRELKRKRDIGERPRIKPEVARPKRQYSHF